MWDELASIKNEGTQSQEEEADGRRWEGHDVLLFLLFLFLFLLLLLLLLLLRAGARVEEG